MKMKMKIMMMKKKTLKVYDVNVSTKVRYLIELIYHYQHIQVEYQRIQYKHHLLLFQLTLGYFLMQSFYLTRILSLQMVMEMVDAVMVME